MGGFGDILLSIIKSVNESAANAADNQLKRNDLSSAERRRLEEMSSNSKQKVSTINDFKKSK